MDIKNLLEIRKRSKAKKPDFIRQDFHKKCSLKKKWRKPKGLQSKLRLEIRGKAKSVSQGYRSPKKVRGLHKSGLEEKRVITVKDLETLDAKKHILIIPSTLGKKNKIVVLKKAKELDFNVSNIDRDGFIKKVETEIEAKKKAKEKEKKVVKEKAKKKEKLAEKISEEDEKEIEKKKKDKLLTTRER
ncbi:50S ribosomal protein L32e [Candidatus Woesearchaeota archaeon]|nr:50S ribosomal protein L32e [Candidatus Woesearchaeota archaeon]|tara:strand:- start:2222 stop:2782 length:561 start_codon:yes stop_codon:yes gene_type:complete